MRSRSPRSGKPPGAGCPIRIRLNRVSSSFANRSSAGHSARSLSRSQGKRSPARGAAVRQARQRFRQRAVGVADAGLGDGAKREPLYAARSPSQRPRSWPGPACGTVPPANCRRRSAKTPDRSCSAAAARPGCARPRRSRADAASARPDTTSASFHARLYASCRPVFMPCAPTGLWMCAASPSRKQRRSRKRAARR